MNWLKTMSKVIRELQKNEMWYWEVVPVRIVYIIF